MNSILKDDSPMGRLAVSLKQQINPCAGLKGKLVPSEPGKRSRKRGPYWRPPLQGSSRVLGPRPVQCEQAAEGCRRAGERPGLG